MFTNTNIFISLKMNMRHIHTTAAAVAIMKIAHGDKKKTV